MTPSQPDFEVPAEHPDDTVAPDTPASEAPVSGTAGQAPGATASDGTPAAGTLDRALDLVRFLRANCEWDAAQTPQSLLPYLLEETHETADAIAAGNDTALADELGDLLLNVAFQIVLAEERGGFSADDVVAALEAKMRRRHPHIYGNGQRIEWETLKAQERDQLAGASLLHGIGSGLEPLSRAQRIQERVATVGFDWPDTGGALAKVHEEVEEVSELLGRGGSEELEGEIGDLLFAVVNLARLGGVHSMWALVRANAKFAARFGALEDLARARGVRLGEATLEELDVLWEEVKENERGSGSVGGSRDR